MKIINPATEETLKDLTEDGPAQINEKYHLARMAQASWAARPLKARLEAIEKFKTLLMNNVDSLATVQSQETGKPVSQARNEIKALPPRIDFFLKNTERVLQPEQITRETGLEETIHWEPLGVIANISAWNYPYFVGTNVFIPALLVGNTVLYKPSEFASLTGLEIARLLHEAGVPKDVFIPVLGSGKAGAAVLEQDVNGVFFTGSYATGRKIAETVAGRLIKLQLELGGKDPTYVLEDADIPSAAAGLADGAFYNTGQSCCAVERIYVHQEIYEPFVEAFVKTVKAFEVGPPADPATYIGPLTRQPQLDILDDQVADARAKGARLLLGGSRMKGKGYYFEPTVLADVTQEMKVVREESFGPIIGIQSVKTDEEAVQKMNDTDYGLTAGVFGKDRSRVETLLPQLNVGSTYWNCCDRVSPNLPWTGRRHSGIGSTLSHHGIRTFLQPKAWHLKP